MWSLSLVPESPVEAICFLDLPRITSEEWIEMEKLPEGYKYLGTMQRRLGYEIDARLATPRNEGWGKMYAAMEAWLDGAKELNL